MPTLNSILDRIQARTTEIKKTAAAGDPDSPYVKLAKAIEDFSVQTLTYADLTEPGYAVAEPPATASINEKLASRLLQQDAAIVNDLRTAALGLGMLQEVLGY